MKHLTVRGVPDNLAKALNEERSRRGKSLNETVIQLLRQGLGVQPEGLRNNGLSRLAGSWSAEEHREFEQNVAVTEQIDPELWR
jgi:hypothetical protein